MPSVHTFKNYIKTSQAPLPQAVFKTARWLKTLNMPPIKLIHQPLHICITTLTNSTLWLIRTFYWKPVFMMQVSNAPQRMIYEGVGLPFRLGPLKITIGDDCRIAARIALIGRSASAKTPILTIGNNVGIGWRTGIYVGTSITIGDNVRIAGEGSLSGYPGHPIDAIARARGDADTDDQAKDIIIENDVWLGRGVMVNAGVTIGQGTIVGAGSVVTKDLPPRVLAGGIPARVIRPL